MAKKFLTPISVLNLSADPQSANEGDIYYNTSSDVLRIYANSSWTDVSSGGGASLPDQSGNSGKYLTTNGTSASWDAINLGTDTTGNYVASITGTTNEIEVTGSGSENAAVTLSLPATINANTTGSAASLTTARTISLGGDLSGSASFNGTSNVTITAAVADDSHNHVISNIDNLQTALDAKSPLASPTFTGALSVINANSSTIPMAYGSRFGYSTGYRILVIGDTNSSNFNSVGIGYDPISNASGSFTGNGGEVFFRNAVKFKTPNADNNGFLTPMEFTSTGIVDIKNDLIVSGGDITLGGTGRIQGIDTVSANTDAANKTYVDTGLGLKADDNTVVHLAGTETITGAKTFSATINGADVDLTGTLTATSKSFDIEHPTKEGMRLRYGSLEGPENGVYVRGKSKSSTITLPDYWTGLVDEDSITVQLTPIGKHKKLYVKDTSNNTVTIGGCRGDFEFFYFIQAERKDIDKLVVEYGS